MFYSSNFYFDKHHSSELSIHLVSEESNVLNEYGISYNEGENEITLSFCYANEHNEALVWTDVILENLLEWFITDDYKEFVSEDNDEIVYFLKGKSYVKRFSPDMRGMVDITFKTLNNYGYRYYSNEIINNGEEFIISNYSNVSKPYKPIIELKNISDDTIVIKNLTTNKDPFIINDLSKDTFIDNTLGTITDIEGKNLIMNSNRKWVELAKGDNSILVEGNCTVIFKAYYPNMV